MEKINFIPANELPVAESDEVSVLCLENGEMKQKPANMGGEEWDAIILIDWAWGYPTSLHYPEFETGSIDAIMAKLNAHQIPKVKIKWNCFPSSSHIGNSICYEAQCQFNVSSYGVISMTWPHAPEAGWAGFIIADGELLCYTFFVKDTNEWVEQNFPD